jgi:hypothetical protein
MSKLNKVLLSIFIIVFLVSIIEAGYYFFHFVKKVNFPSKESTEPPLNSSKPEEIRSPNRNSTRIFITPTPDLDQAISLEWLGGLRLLRKGVVKSSVFTNIYEGQIIELDTRGGQKSGYPYQIKLKIKAENGQTNELFYPAKSVNNAKIIELINGKDKTVNGILKCPFFGHLNCPPYGE